MQNLNLTNHYTDVTKILSVFYFPGDLPKQDKFYLQYLQRVKLRGFVRKHDQSGEISQSLGEFDYESGLISQKERRQRLKEVMLVGIAFCYIYDMQVSGIEEPSKSKAVWLVSSELGLSESQLNNHWRKYQDVVHLCAAYAVHAWQISDDRADDGIVFYGQWLNTLIDIARRLWEWGKQLNDRNGRPLLSDASWEPPQNYETPLEKLNIKNMLAREVRLDMILRPNPEKSNSIFHHQPPLAEKLKRYCKI